MGELLAAVAVLADVRTTIGHFVGVFLYVYIALIFVHILSTWLQLPHSSTLARIQRFLFDVCDPYLRLFRRFIRRFFGSGAETGIQHESLQITGLE